MKRYLLTLISIIPLLSGCIEMPGDVNSPQWNTDLNLPLTHKNYTLDELIKTDKYISIDNQDGFIFQAHHNANADKLSVEQFIEGNMDQSGTGITIPMTDGEGFVGIPFTKGMELDSAKFLRGNLTITVRNESTSDLDISMILPAFISSSGQPLTKQAIIPPGGNKDFVEDLTGYRYDVSKSKFKSDSLEIDGSISGNDFNGAIKIDYKIENTMFSYIAGKIPALAIDPLRSTTGLPISDDVTDFRDKIKFFDATLTLNGEYIDKLAPTDPNEPFKMKINNLYIKGIRKNSSQTIDLKLNANSNNNLGPISITNGKMSEKYDETNSNISDFLAFMPDSIVVTAESTINPDNERGAATNLDSIQFGFDLLLKSRVSITDLIVSDTLDLSIDDDARSNIEDFRAATIYLKIDNAIAFGGKIVMDFADSNYKHLFTLDTINFEPATVNATGNPSVNHTEPIIELNYSQLQELAKSYNIIMHVIINTTDSHNGQQVVFSANDWLDIISFCTIKYHINLDD